jgi:CheY-like chemotaxis protein
MKNRTKTARDLKKVSHFFLSGQNSSVQGKEHLVEGYKGDADDVAWSSIGKVRKGRLVPDFFTIFNDMVSRVDVSDHEIFLGTDGPREAAQDIQKLPKVDLTLNDFLRDRDEQAKSETAHGIEAAESSVDKEKTILFVDADEYLLALSKEILSSFGYRVLTANNGESALELYKREGRGIDLVILEVIMPGIGGRRCLEELLKLHREVKVIMNSSISENRLLKSMTKGSVREYITKPYHFSQMLKVIRRVSDKDERKTN